MARNHIQSTGKASERWRSEMQSCVLDGSWPLSSVAMTSVAMTQVATTTYVPVDVFSTTNTPIAATTIKHTDTT